MTTISLHGFAPSTFVRTARMAAHELNVPYELEPLDFRSKSHCALHPFLRMPVLTDGDTTIFETLAIIAFLDDQADGAPLIPMSGEARWRELSAVSALLDYAYQPVVHGEDATAKKTTETVLGWAEGTLSTSPNLTGVAIHASDLLFAPMIAHWLSKPGTDSIFENYPATKLWFNAIAERTSFKETAA